MTVSSTLQVRQVGTTFAGEVAGLDFTKPFPPGLREEVEQLMYQYGVLIFRDIPGMCNERHLEFSRMFGELDSNPLTFGKKTRLENANLFDISNLAADGKTILEPTDIRFKFGKVMALPMELLIEGKCALAC
jgi:alpha-ketoglutarate-dependent 2,4-dichlorophenoxyacetate dioxygenase